MKLKVDHLTGGYSKQPVLHDLNFEINSGEIVGLIGLNGAGKSTTIKHIIGLLKPMAGQIQLNGQTLTSDNAAYRKAFAYIPELPVLYEELTLREHIALTAMAYGIDFDKALTGIMPLLNQFRLEDRLDWLPVHFSKGMRQKVMIVCAFMIVADLYIIDEPFLGLDPLASNDFIDLLQQCKAKGAGVLMSTHELQRAQQYCDRYLFLQNGVIIADGSLAEIRALFAMPNASLEEIYLKIAKESDSHNGVA